MALGCGSHCSEVIHFLHKPKHTPNTRTHTHIRLQLRSFDAQQGEEETAEPREKEREPEIPCGVLRIRFRFPKTAQIMFSKRKMKYRKFEKEREWKWKMRMLMRSVEAIMAAMIWALSREEERQNTPHDEQTGIRQWNRDWNGCFATTHTKSVSSTYLAVELPHLGLQGGTRNKSISLTHSD